MAHLDEGVARCSPARREAVLFVRGVAMAHVATCSALRTRGRALCALYVLLRVACVWCGLVPAAIRAALCVAPAEDGRELRRVGCVGRATGCDVTAASGGMWGGVKCRDMSSVRPPGRLLWREAEAGAPHPCRSLCVWWQYC